MESVQIKNKTQLRSLLKNKVVEFLHIDDKGLACIKTTLSSAIEVYEKYKGLYTFIVQYNDICAVIKLT